MASSMDFKHPRPVETLSPRQREILDRMLTGMSIIEIAQDLGISDFTVTQHRLCILGRLGVI